jgi:cobalamin biosynthesis protein CobW
LLDPVIFREAALDAVICVTDARMLVDQADLADDALWKSQLGAADYIALSKTDLVSPAECDRVRDRLRRHKPDRVITHMVDGRIPPELLFSADLHRPSAGPALKSMMALPAFQTVSWTSRFPLIMARFESLISEFATSLVRAKGIVEFAERPGQAMLFQLVGTRATISPAPTRVPQADAVQLVFIARSGALDEAALATRLAACCVKQLDE